MKSENLRPQDIMIALWIAVEDQPSVKNISANLKISLGDVSNGITRLQFARLIQRQGRDRKCNTSNLFEFVVHGVKYCFPGILGAPARGIPTAWGHSFFSSKIRSDSSPVYSSLNGKHYGPEISPLYKSLPLACEESEVVYQITAIVDCLRIGKARDISLAENQLKKYLRLP